MSPRSETRAPRSEPTFAPTEEILAELREGRMVVIVDDEDRENEGDLVLAATMVRAQDINFMARFGRGLICLTLTRERCQALRLPLMVDSSREGDADTTSARRTNFTVSIEAAAGVTTGISAQDRARTVRAAVAANARPEDLRQPRHIFPIMAQPGGVLRRAGHTEAGCDLARLAGLEPAAVIVEILNDDGTMARRPELSRFASEHGLKIGSIADLIAHRLRHEASVERIGEGEIATGWGAFRWIAYDDVVTRSTHLALVRGELATVEAPLVRVHVPGALEDLLGITGRDDGGWTLQAALSRIASEGVGAVVLLRHGESRRDLLASLLGAGVPAGSPDTARENVDAKSESPLDAPPGGTPVASTEGEPTPLRTHGTGARILRDLGVRRMRVLGAPKQLSAISGFGLEALEFVEPAG